MKTAHLADLHCCRENAEAALASLRFFAESIKKSPVDMACIAGDAWDASMLNTEASGFNRFIDAIRDIANIAPVAMIYGTPTHDTDGSLEVFRKITCKHGITVLEPGQAYFLDVARSRILAEGEAIYEDGVQASELDALIFGIPEPRKKYLLAGTSAGKDETEEAIRNAMHKMCYLLAAKRREYPDVPCVVLYHGEVAGTVYQNDMTVERGTGISITIDDLNGIGADYYALGHIHKPQKVGNINAYYAGSIYPNNFGETHQAGFNIAEIIPAETRGFITGVSRVDFPHPQNLKVELKYDEELPFDKIEGKKVWAEITGPKEKTALIDIGKKLESLLGRGAVKGSRVTLRDIPVETVRAAEIAEANTPSKKFEVWASNSDTEAVPSVTEKIKTLETEILKGVARVSGEWELASMKLRGATGIKKGILRDEISIDFTGYDSGLIALVGGNGRGKTTLIENCHPYPHLHTRRGKLQNHFSLRDSYREVIFADRSLKGAGRFVKFLIQIDGQNKSGSCKYYIFDARGFGGVNSVAEWVPRPGVDGTLKPYEEELENAFGPAELYLRTAFSAQRPTKDLPDLADATAGEKKTLFAELAGIEYLQRFSDSANDKAKHESGKSHDLNIRARMLEGAVAQKSRVEERKSETEKYLAAGRELLKEVTELVKTAKLETEKAQALFRAEEERARKEIEARKAVEQVTGEIKSIEADITVYEETSKGKADDEKQIAEHENLKKTLDAENEKKRKHLEAAMKKQQAYIKEKSAHDEKVKALETERNELNEQKGVAISGIVQTESVIRNCERDAAEIKENCPTCGQILSEAKLAELKSKRESFLERIAERQKALEGQNKRLSDLSYAIKNINDEIADIGLDEPCPAPAAVFDEAALREITNKINSLDKIESVRARLEKAGEAKARLEGLRSQLTDKEKLLDERENLVRELMKGVDDAAFGRLQKELDAAASRHGELTEKYADTKARIAGSESALEEIKNSLAQIEAREKELESVKAEIAVCVREETEWNLVSKAFGKDGIQALELDALAPGISGTANKILESAYGDRFSISIETTRIGGAGKKTKQIEDFIIKVTDSEDGEAVNLEDKSGGEAVWIKRAVYDAFGVIRKRNTGFAFLTCFQDEADGALDSAAKTAYCRMLEASRAESNLRHTIIITHSNEVKAMIDQKIDMEVLALKGAA